MNNPAIEQALIELEDSLSKIESARTQVNKVAEKSELLIKAFNKVYDAITSVDQNLVVDEKAIKNQLDESFRFFKSGLTEIVKESDKSVKSLQTSLSSYESKLNSLLNTSVEKTDSKLNDFVSNLTSKYSEKNKELRDATNKVLASISSINTTISIDKELVAKQLNDNFLYFNSALERIVKEFEKGIRELERTHALQEVKFAESLKTIATQTENKLNHTLNEIEKKASFLSDSIQNATVKLNNFENNVNTLEQKLEEIDIRTEWQRIEQKVDLNRKVTLIIGAVILLAIIGLSFLK